MVPVIQVVCVVSKGRARRGKVFRMRALAVWGELRCQGLATDVLGRLQEEVAMVAGTRYKPVVDLASCT